MDKAFTDSAPASTGRPVFVGGHPEVNITRQHDGSGWMQSRAVARQLGIATGTLKKWRLLGKGPKRWKRISKTVVVYEVSSVIEFQNDVATYEPEKGEGFANQDE